MGRRLQRGRLERVAAHLLPAAPAAAQSREAPFDQGTPWNNGELLAPRAITAITDYPAADEHRPELTKDEIEHFKRTGYVIKRGLIPAARLQPFVERLWDRAPECVDRDRPATWVDPDWPNTPSDRPGHGSNLEVLSGDSRWWWGEIGHDPAFMDATCRHPNVLRTVEALLGGPIKLPTRNRGLYTVRTPLPKVEPAVMSVHYLASYRQRGV